MVKTNRIWWLEALRAIALFMVIVPHFIVSFCPHAFCVWDTYSWALKGISGKHGVAIFCVLIGYFSSRKTEKSLPSYIVQRYFQFFVNILIVLVVYVLVVGVGLRGEGVQLVLRGFKEAFFFRAGLVPTFWCVMAMFEGSLICFVLGNYCIIVDKRINVAFLLIVCVFLKYVDVWLSICVLGVILRTSQEFKFSTKAKLTICAISVCLIPLLYRHPESTLTYFSQGCSTVLFVFVCSCISELSWVKGRRGLIVLPYLGNISFYMFLWHTPVNAFLQSIHYEKWNLFLLFGVSFAISMFLSIIQHWLNYKWINPVLRKIQIETI